MCSLYGELYILLDSPFSFIYNINNQKATIGEVLVLKDGVELVCHKWLTLGLSFTPKIHLFLDRVIFQIQEIKGYIIMGKEHIERAHQRRHRMLPRGSTNRNKLER